LWGGWMTPSPAAADEPAKSEQCAMKPDEVAEPAPKVRHISPDELYSTLHGSAPEHTLGRGQPIPDLTDSAQRGWKERLETGEVRIRFAPPPNIFLVRAASASVAAMRSAHYLTGEITLEQAVNPWYNPWSPYANEFWLVVDLDRAHSSPLAYKITSITVSDEGRLRVVYTRHEGLASRDLVSYCLWIPVGELKPGRYALELFDGDADQPDLIRYVTVMSAEDIERFDAPQ
jgi:hypothetical protein